MATDPIDVGYPRYEGYGGVTFISSYDGHGYDNYSDCTTGTIFTVCDMFDQATVLFSHPPDISPSSGPITFSDMDATDTSRPPIEIGENIVVEGIKMTTPETAAASSSSTSSSTSTSSSVSAPAVETTTTDGRIRVTDKVFVVSEPSKFLIRIDGEVFAYASERRTAMDIIDSIAADTVKKQEGPSVKVFRRELKEGLEVQIYVQSLGFVYNGSPRRVATLDIVPVSKAYVSVGSA